MVTHSPGRHKLIKSFVDKLTEAGYYRDTELPGFCVRVWVSKKNGRISKYYLVNNKPRGSRQNVTVTIGKPSIMSAEQARIEAKRILSLLAQGINPNTASKERRKETRLQQKAEEEKEKLEQTTLQSVLDHYLASRRLKAKTAQDYIRFLKRSCSDWLSMPIIEIDRDMIQNRHLAMSSEHPAQANYTMRILRALFKYAMAVYEDGDGKSLLIHNPVDRLKHVRLWNRIPRRQTVIRSHQFADWYKGVCALRNSTARDMLLLEVFTGARHSEAARLEWSHIDFKANTILFVDTKNHDDHLFPISTQLRQILLVRRATAGASKYVFPSINGDSRHISDIRDSIKQVVNLSGVPFTEHDLRRTFETTAESLDISYYTLKRLLNHKTGSDPTAGYIVTSAERLREANQRIADTLAFHMKLGMKKSHSSVRRHKGAHR